MRDHSPVAMEDAIQIRVNYLPPGFNGILPPMSNGPVIPALCDQNIDLVQRLGRFLSRAINLVEIRNVQNDPMSAAHFRRRLGKRCLSRSHKLTLAPSAASRAAISRSCLKA